MNSYDDLTWNDFIIIREFISQQEMIKTKINDKTNFHLENFPSPNSFQTEEDFKNACDLWFKVASNEFSQEILPLPISISVVFPIKGPIFQYPNNRKLLIGNNQINELYDIVLNGSKINPEMKFKNSFHHRNFTISTFFQKEQKWGSKLIPQFPYVKCFDTYEDYKNAANKWMENVKILINEKEETHPTIFEQKLSIPINKPTRKNILQSELINSKHERQSLYPKNDDSTLIKFKTFYERFIKENSYYQHKFNELEQNITYNNDQNQIFNPILYYNHVNENVNKNNCVNNLQALLSSYIQEGQTISVKDNEDNDEQYNNISLKIYNFDHFVFLLEKEITSLTKQEKDTLIHYFVEQVNMDNALINSTIINSLPLLWKILCLLRTEYECEAPIDPLLSKISNIKSSNCILLTNSLFILNTYHITSLIHQILVKNFQTNDFLIHVNFAQEVATMFLTNFEKDLKEFLIKGIKEENVYQSLVLIKLLLWVNSTNLFTDIFNTLFQILSLSKDCFNSLSSYIFMHKNAFNFVFNELLTSNLARKFYESTTFVYFCSELLNLAIPIDSNHEMVWILPLLSQFVQALTSTNKVEISYMIRCLISFVRRSIKHNQSFADAKPCETLLFLALCSPSLISKSKVNLLYACSDLADQENVLESFYVNQRQLENIICNAAEIQETIQPTIKFIRRIIIGQQSHLYEFLNSGNIEPILVEFFSSPQLEMDAFFNISKILLSLSTKSSLSNGMKQFFNIIKRSNYHYFDILRNQLQTSNKFLVMKIARELEKKPYYPTIQKMLE